MKEKNNPKEERIGKEFLEKEIDKGIAELEKERKEENTDKKNKEDLIEENKMSIQVKKDLGNNLEKAIILNKVNTDLLENLIQEESHVLNVLENENSRILNEIDSKVGKYEDDKKDKGYIQSFNGNGDEKKYDSGKMNFIEVKVDGFVRFKDQEKKKDEKKYIAFKPGY